MLCVEHHQCAYHNQVLHVKYTETCNTRIKIKPEVIQHVFCAINHVRCEDRAICDRNVNEIIKKSVVKVKRYERPSDLEVSGHSLRVGAAQDLLIKGYDLAAIMRAGGWSNAETVSRYLRSSQHNIWK